jgi:2-polyprenyl-3-methyl-5-hydroxy-6-metoxy-1,4-benzoquinol methylase
MNYNQFHGKPKIQKRIISASNYTYHNVIGCLHQLPVDIQKGGLNILDYGCGVGTISFYLAKFGNKVLGLDISDTAIKAAKISASSLNLKNVIYKKCSATTLQDLKNKQFDLIVCTEVLEHVDNDSFLLAQFNELLKHKGCLLISTPSVSAPLYKLGLLKSFDKNVGHLRRYDKISLVSNLQNAGFITNSISTGESVIKNVLFCINIFNPLVKFVRGPIGYLMIKLEDPLVSLIGGSNLYVIATKP